MTVKELIEHLKKIPPGTPVLAKDIFGKPSTYIVLRCGPDGLAIDAVPEPDTRYYKHPFDGPGDEHPFDGPGDDRYCPGPCNGDFNE